MTGSCIVKQLSDMFILLQYKILLYFISKQLIFLNLTFHFIFKVRVTVLVHMFVLHVNLRDPYRDPVIFRAMFHLYVPIKRFMYRRRLCCINHT
jgi:hypothetical protein